MDRADAVSIHHEVTDLVTVILSGGGAVESAGEDAFFQHQHTTDKGAVTRAPFRYGVGDLHKIRVPVWAHDVFLQDKLLRIISMPLVTKGVLWMHTLSPGGYTLESKSDAEITRRF